MELLVVAAVTGVLATLVIPTGLTFWRSWKERQLKRSLAQIRVAIDAYHVDWERGCIESENEKGWPDTLEELLEEKDLTDLPGCRDLEARPAATAPGGAPQQPDPDAEAPKRRYLRTIPVDPFNEDGDTLDVSGWKALAYDDDWDASSWGGEGVYDVRSGSPLRALDGTKYEEW